MRVYRKGEYVKLSLTPHEAAIVAGALATTAALFIGDKDTLTKENNALCQELAFMTGAASLSQAELQFAENAVVDKARNPKDVHVLIDRIIEHQKVAMRTAPKKKVD